uniref:OmpA-OmpF porin, OOP family n=1 Tax=Candidatus Kentrum sp. FW TaxID=2126338 RepID=A0A450TZ86_9GAMM|nr:MAG: OmpA-OmpF porin, OOP family [Candidatus Kentron sp. FW]
MKILHLLVLSIALVISGCASIDFRAPDSDKDGVPNDKDKCPNTKGISVCEKFFPCPDSNGKNVLDDKYNCLDTKGISAEDYCGCPDSDGDGVPDNRDECPDTKGVRLCEKGFSQYSGPEDMLKCWDRRSKMEGIHVDGKGCPMDSDGDGVSDYRDQCPNTRPGIKVDDKGCIAEPVICEGLGCTEHKNRCEKHKMECKKPKRSKPKKTCEEPGGCPDSKAACKKLFIDLPRKIHFDFDKYYIGHEDSYILDDVIKALKSTDIRIHLEGYADDIGTEEYNLHLSRKRAWEVKNYLVSRGIPADGITTEGKGQLFPITHDRTRQDRPKNRRVEILCQPRSEP